MSAGGAAGGGSGANECGHRYAVCLLCNTRIVFANVLLLTLSLLVFQCDGCDSVLSARDLDDDVREAVTEPFTPRLPYVAAPNAFLPLDRAAEASIMLLGLQLADTPDVETFIAHTVNAGGQRKVAPPDGAP